MTNEVSVLDRMSASSVAKVSELEQIVLSCPQTLLPTNHVFHAGTYSRTIMIPEGCVLTGALIKIDTVLIFNGDAVIFGEGGSSRITGHHVLTGLAGRKQAFLAMLDTYLTMVFATSSDTVDEAEREFTDEYGSLMSRFCDSINTIVGGA